VTAHEERFLVCAPTGRDAPLTRDLLARAGLACAICGDVAEVIRRVDQEGAAGVLLAEETLTPAAIRALTEMLARQPAWSDLAILVFSSPEGSLRRVSGQVVERLGNVTLLDRPLRPITMLSSARAALRARRRQYALRAELDEQQLAVKRRDEFLAMLGHELRNPLSAMLLALEVLDRGEGNAAKLRAVLRRQTQHLARLVDDLLDVSRVTSGKIVLKRGHLDLAALVRRCVAAMEPTIAAQAHEISVSVPPARVPVLGDPDRLEQVVVNLLSNAVKYTPPGGHIDVRVEVVAGVAELHVADDGAGIAEDMLAHVFDLFTQAPETLDRARGGLGIGLTLVRSLVALHGGAIQVESAGPGRGSRFTVQLPVVDDQAEALDPPPVVHPPAETGREVLVVEDNADTRETLCELLAELGHSVAAAADGLEAVERARAIQPEVLVVDIGLPGIDGYEVARRVRAERGDSVTLIAVTGYGQPEDQRRAFDAGFDHHFTKPVDIDVLARLLGGNLAPPPPV
jgi:signal transduction histidine kinase/CheY-like chemotaxis protein